MSILAQIEFPDIILLTRDALVYAGRKIAEGVKVVKIFPVLHVEMCITGYGIPLILFNQFLFVLFCRKNSNGKINLYTNSMHVNCAM